MTQSSKPYGDFYSNIVCRGMEIYIWLDLSSNCVKARVGVVLDGKRIKVCGGLDGKKG